MESSVCPQVKCNKCPLQGSKWKVENRMEPAAGESGLNASECLLGKGWRRGGCEGMR